jgi:hydrogenase nickel incorporation protein HypA/HybF
MHELSIALSIIDAIADESAARGLGGVEVVHLKLGAFSGVDREALLFAWRLACEGTPIEQCGFDRSPPSLYEICCPECGRPAETIVTGKEIEVVSLEVAA